jgi:Tfp pilus assembly protein PilO
MDTLTALPVWVQLVLGVLAAVVLVVMNAGWLLAAKGQLDARKRQYADQQKAARERTQAPPRQ